MKRTQEQIECDYNKIITLVGEASSITELEKMTGLTRMQMIKSLEKHDISIGDFRKKLKKSTKSKKVKRIKSDEVKSIQKEPKKYVLDTCFVIKMGISTIESLIKDGLIIILPTHVIRELKKNLEKNDYCKTALSKDEKHSIIEFFNYAISHEQSIKPEDSDTFDGRNVDECIIKFCIANSYCLLTCDKEMCLLARAKGIKEARYFDVND